jgi:GNAT superfamily N-acetyltransferase
VTSGWSIAPAEAAHVPALPAIERAAAARFSPADVPAAVAAEATSLADLEEARRAGWLWVALAGAGAPIGFVICEVVDGVAHVEEIDVHPAHAGRGVGKALLRAVFAAAAARGHQAVTLTTFADVPWNGPFYARLGFRVLAPEELTPGLAAILADEARRGLDPAKRVAMRRELP